MGTKTTPEIDWSLIKLPTDQITVSDIRRLQPNVFSNSDRGSSSRLTNLVVFQAVAAEMDLAARAFCKVLGQPNPVNSILGRGVLVRSLLKSYEQMGIGAGEAVRKSLIHQIETDAQMQARRHIGQAK